MGYVVNSYGGKAVILGDTSDPSPIVPLAVDSSVLVHEGTNFELGESTGDNKEGPTARSKAISRGHSTVEMAAEFAERIRAKMLVLNHISNRFVILLSPFFQVLALI